MLRRWLGQWSKACFLAEESGIFMWYLDISLMWNGVVLCSAGLFSQQSNASRRQFICGLNPNYNYIPFVWKLHNLLKETVVELVISGMLWVVHCPRCCKTCILSNVSIVDLAQSCTFRVFQAMQCTACVFRFTTGPHGTKPRNFPCISHDQRSDHVINFL